MSKVRTTVWGGVFCPSPMQISVGGMDQNRCTEQDIRILDTLPFKRKLIFSTHKITGVNSNIFMKEFAGKNSVGDPYKKGHIYYRYLAERLNKF